jgi:hypothetical protein
MTDVSQAITLQNVLESACFEVGCSRETLTVLAIQNDPYRQDTPLNHLTGKWVVKQFEKAFRPGQRVHLRAFHYALVQAGDVRKPDRTVYRNTFDDWAWLCRAVKKARWLGYLPFERIVDNRNEEPAIFRSSGSSEPGARHLYGGVSSSGEESFSAKLDVTEAGAVLLGFTRAQPYALAIFGEKSSLEDVLLPIARRFDADLYLGQGEISDTLIHQMAKDGAEDGRPMVVVTCCDFDPAGHQMPVSIGRKLQAFRDLLFPELRFEVVPAALTVETVRELELPSTPLKPSELRGSKWRAEFGVEQTEIDALLTPQREGELRQIVEAAIAPYYDTTLADRIQQAKMEWQREAEAAIDEHVGADELADLQQEADDADEDAREKIEAIQNEVRATAEALNDRFGDMLDGVELPEAPDLPEAELPERPPGSVLVSSDWTWADQTRALKERKSYGAGEDEDES